MFMNIFPNNPASKEIFNLPSLVFFRIKVVPYKISGPSQCHACQSFGHSSAHYGYTFRCFKWGDNHITRECLKTSDQLVKCCNYGGKDTVNYLKCPSYMTQITILKQKQNGQLRSNNIETYLYIYPFQIFETIYVKSYADATKSSIPDT